MVLKRFLSVRMEATSEVYGRDELEREKVCPAGGARAQSLQDEQKAKRVANVCVASNFLKQASWLDSSTHAAMVRGLCYTAQWSDLLTCHQKLSAFKGVEAPLQCQVWTATF